MTKNTGKVSWPDRAGRKVASGLVGVGSAAAIAGAGVAAALHGHAVGQEQDAGVQQAVLTASLSQAPAVSGLQSAPAPIVGPSTPGINTFGFSGQVGLSLPEAFPSVFGGSGQQAVFNPDGLSTILNVSPPRDSGIAGSLPLNNVQAIFGNLLSPAVNPGQPSLPQPSGASTNFIDPQPQFVDPDLASLQSQLSGIVFGSSPAAQAAITQAANQVSSNLQAIDGIFSSLQANSPQPPTTYTPTSPVQDFQNPFSPGNPALPGQTPDWANEFNNLFRPQGTSSIDSGSTDNGAAVTQSPQLAQSPGVSPDPGTGTGVPSGTPSAGAPTVADAGTPVDSPASQPAAAPDTTPAPAVPDTTVAYDYDPSATFDSAGGSVG